jgi:hypothetical protein
LARSRSLDGREVSPVRSRRAHVAGLAAGPMKFVEPSTFADLDVAARKLVEIANAVEAVQDGRIFAASLSNWSTARSSKLVAHRINSAPRSRARLRWVGCCGTRAGPT